MPCGWPHSVPFPTWQLFMQAMMAAVVVAMAGLKSQVLAVPVLQGLLRLTELSSVQEWSLVVLESGSPLKFPSNCYFFVGKQLFLACLHQCRPSGPGSAPLSGHKCL